MCVCVCVGGGGGGCYTKTQYNTDCADRRILILLTMNGRHCRDCKCL